MIIYIKCTYIFYLFSVSFYLPETHTKFISFNKFKGILLNFSLFFAFRRIIFFSRTMNKWNSVKIYGQMVGYWIFFCLFAFRLHNFRNFKNTHAWVYFHFELWGSRHCLQKEFLQMAVKCHLRISPNNHEILSRIVEDDNYVLFVWLLLPNTFGI